MTGLVPQPQPTVREKAVVGLLLGLALYCVYFRGLSQMGLYEDDWSAIAPSAGADWASVWGTVRNWLTHWPNGRPLGLSTCSVASWALYNLGGLPALYLIPFSIVLGCAWTLYRILADSLGSIPAFLGALTLALLPTDTLRLSLHGTPHMHLAMLFLLLAMRGLQTGREWAAAPFVFTGLLFHESATLTAFIAPLLFLDWNKAYGWRSVRYWLFVVAGLGTIFCLRVFVFSEARATATFSNPAYVLERSLGSLKGGTSTHWTLLMERGPNALRFPTPGIAIAIGSILAVIFFVLIWQRKQPMPRAGHGPRWLRPLTAVFFGVLALSIPYLVYFTDPYWPAHHVAGRTASVHSASGLGFAIIVGGLAGFLMLIPWAVARTLTLALGALPLAALLSWGNVVRVQYLEAWQNQQAFWRELVPNLGGIRSNTIIFSARDSHAAPPFTWVIGSNSWGDALVLNRLYEFPADWSREPRAFLVFGPMQDQIRLQNGQFVWHMPTGDWPEADIVLEPGNVMLFRNIDGKPVPVEGDIEISGQKLKLMSPSHGKSPAFKRKPLFHDLLGDTFE